MTDAFSSLYPAEAGRIGVVLGFGVPRLANPPPSVRNLGSARDFYGQAMLAEFEVDGRDRIAFIDKAFPHSRYDLMMLASDDDIRCAVTELGPVAGELVFEIAHRFLTYLGDPETIDRYGLSGGRFHLCYNYDRDTQDRENSMFYDKRFHLHLNYWPGSDLRAPAVVRWGDIDSGRLRRRLLDPITFLATSVMRDATGGVVAGRPVMPVDDRRDLAMGLPPGLKIRFDGWDVLRGRRITSALETLHEVADTAYRRLHRAFTGEEHAPAAWRRPRLLSAARIRANLDDVDWLSPDSREGLARLAGALRDVDEADMQRFRSDEALRVHRMALGGLDYAIGMFSRACNRADAPLVAGDEVYLTMQCRLFGDIGGAGLPPLGDAAIVKLDRSAGPAMSAAELESRRELRCRFLEAELPALAERYRLRRLDAEGEAT